MNFNLNELLMAVSKALDYVEMDIFGKGFEIQRLPNF